MARAYFYWDIFTSQKFWNAVFLEIKEKFDKHLRNLSVLVVTSILNGVVNMSI